MVWEILELKLIWEVIETYGEETEGTQLRGWMDFDVSRVLLLDENDSLTYNKSEKVIYLFLMTLDMIFLELFIFWTHKRFDYSSRTLKLSNSTRSPGEILNNENLVLIAIYVEASFAF